MSFSVNRPVSSFKAFIRAPAVGGAGSTTGVIAGKITENCTPVVRTVRLYQRSDGAKIDTTTSSATTGEYSFTVPDKFELYYVVALDDDAGVSYNAVIADKVHGE